MSVFFVIGFLITGYVVLLKIHFFVISEKTIYMCYVTVLRVNELHDAVECEMYNRNTKAYSDVD
jgi:hypothetical protein